MSLPLPTHAQKVTHQPGSCSPVLLHCLRECVWVCGCVIESVFSFLYVSMQGTVHAALGCSALINLLRALPEWTAITAATSDPDPRRARVTSSASRRSRNPNGPGAVPSASTMAPGAAATAAAGAPATASGALALLPAGRDAGALAPHAALVTNALGCPAAMLVDHGAAQAVVEVAVEAEALAVPLQAPALQVGSLGSDITYDCM